ncbi:MAG: oxygen-independent coproporphyrinogen III oxidase [Thermochromatium sp.]
MSLTLEFLERHDLAAPGCPMSSLGSTGNEPFTQAQYLDVLDALRQMPDGNLAVYIHVPFCHVRCLYCACDTTVTHSLEKVDQYLDALEREMDMVTERIGRHRPIQELHIGGGTPNHLNEPQLARLMEIIDHHFVLTPESRATIECNPRRASVGQLELIRGLGFDRISFGVQDLNADVQRAIGRVQSLNMVRDVFLTARQTGFERINLDLVYGLPFQTPRSFQATLEQVLDLGPDRVTCFSYSHDPTRRPHQHAINTAHLPTAAEKLALFHRAVHTFTEAGYRWVGLDLFVLEDDELYEAQVAGRLYRNTLGYTTSADRQVLAFGPSGTAELADALIRNEPDLRVWQMRLNNGQFPVAWGRRLNEADRRRRQALLHLMCNLQLPSGLVADLDQEYEQLCRKAEKGLVEISEEGIRVTPQGRYILHGLCSEQGERADCAASQWRFGMSS